MYQKLSASSLQTELTPGAAWIFALHCSRGSAGALFHDFRRYRRLGMNIIKADAFANAAGVVLDTFHFADLHRTLELNPTEKDRFLKSLHDVLQNKAAPNRSCKRDTASRSRPPKVAIQTR